MMITNHNMNLVVQMITKVKTTKSIYDGFTAYDLEIQSDDGTVIRITLFGADRKEIVFENGKDKDMRST